MQVTDPGLLQRYMQLLSKQEQTYVSEGSSEAVQKERLLARTLQRTTLARYLLLHINSRPCLYTSAQTESGHSNFTASLQHNSVASTFTIDSAATEQHRASKQNQATFAYNGSLISCVKVFSTQSQCDACCADIAQAIPARPRCALSAILMASPACRLKKQRSSQTRPCTSASLIPAQCLVRLLKIAA